MGQRFVVTTTPFCQQKVDKEIPKFFPLESCFIHVKFYVPQCAQKLLAINRKLNIIIRLG